MRTIAEDEFNGVEKAIGEAITKGGYQPYRAHFIDYEGKIEEQVVPTPHIISIEDGEENFDFSTDMVVFRFDEEEEGVDFSNAELGYPLHSILLSKEFWKCWGKARGWDDAEEWERVKGKELEDMADVVGKEIGMDAMVYPQNMFEGFPHYIFISGSWQHKWHKFIEHISEGKNINDFFINVNI